MMTKLFVAAAVLAISASAALAGQGTYESDCRSTYVGGRSTVVCTSEYSYSAHARGPSRESVGYNISDEERKAAIRKASGYRDPPGTRDVR